MGTRTLRNLPPKHAKPSVHAAESAFSVGTNGHKPFAGECYFFRVSLLTKSRTTFV
jgi:hypothetical protein